MLEKLRKENSLVGIEKLSKKWAGTNAKSHNKGKRPGRIDRVSCLGGSLMLKSYRLKQL